MELLAGSFRQVPGLLRLTPLVSGNLGTIYKVTWVLEGDEMTGATRASLRGLWMTAVSDNENACYCNIYKEPHKEAQVAEKHKIDGEMALLAVL